MDVASLGAWSWTKEVETAQSETCRRLLAHCHAQICGNWPMPKEILDPVLIPRDLLPWLCIMDVEPDGEFRFRLFGTGLVSGYGRELTGKRLRDTVTGEPIERVHEIFSTAVARRTPLVTLTSFGTPGGPISYERAIIPLSSRTGIISWLLVVLHLLETPGAGNILELVSKPGPSR